MQGSGRFGIAVQGGCEYGNDTPLSEGVFRIDAWLGTAKRCIRKEMWAQTNLALAAGTIVPYYMGQIQLKGPLVRGRKGGRPHVFPIGFIVGGGIGR